MGAACDPCGPSCAVPSCASTSTVGFGSAGYRGLGYGALGYGVGGLAETSGSLGTLAGVIPQPINQIPASEVVIQPPPAVVTIPGPILSPSCEPVTVGGNTPCAAVGNGIVGPGVSGRGILGTGLYGGLGYGLRKGYGLGRRGICGDICL